MTRFQRDYKTCQMGSAIEAVMILKERAAELERIEKQGRASRNAFRTQCLMHEYVKLQSEYNELLELV